MTGLGGSDLSSVARPSVNTRCYCRHATIYNVAVMLPRVLEWLVWILALLLVSHGQSVRLSRGGNLAHYKPSNFPWDADHISEPSVSACVSRSHRQGAT